MKSKHAEHRSLRTYVLVILAMTQNVSSLNAKTSDLIELYEYTGKYPLKSPSPDQRPILMRVPRELRYGSTANATRTWDVQILTFYPSFDSIKDPKNKNYGLNCVGICNGRVEITVEYRPSLSSTNSPNMGDFIARSESEFEKTPPYPPNVVVRDLGPQDGFDEGFEKITTVPDASGYRSSRVARTQTSLFKRSSDGKHFDLAATCDASLTTKCVLHFSSSCNPAIYIAVRGLDITYINRSADIAEKTNKFIEAMIEECN